MEIPNTQKANMAVRALFNAVRKIGISAGTLPRGFPTLARVNLLTVDDAAVDFGGYGGAYAIRAGKFAEPFIIINLAYNRTAIDLMAVIAHECLHIKQTICEGTEPHHNNQFRKDCAEFARLIGCTYWHLNGYDHPSKATFMAIQKRRIAAFEKSRKV
jgi:hypothetical protein